MDVWAYWKKEIRNEDIWDKIRMASVEEKKSEARLRWFTHVKKRCTNVLVRKCERFAMVGLTSKKEVEIGWRSIRER